MLHFGTVNKIYLEYERPFLSPDVDEIVLLWDRMERESEVPMKERWFRKIYSFAKQSDTLLIGWISGEEARCAYTLDILQKSSLRFIVHTYLMSLAVRFIFSSGSWRRSR